MTIGKHLAPLGLALTLTLAACGSSDDAGSKKKHAQATTQATPTPTETAPDADSDGIPDVNDYDPHNAKVQSEADAQLCSVKGIDAKGRESGACTEDNGTQVKVVNQGAALHLKQLSVTLNDCSPTDTIPQSLDNPLVGSFVVCNATITNNLTATAQVNGPDQFALVLGPRVYQADFDAMNQGDDDDLIYRDLQPDESVTGDLVFRVAAKRVGALERNGNLDVYQFSDADSGNYEHPKHRMGIIRTYQ